MNEYKQSDSVAIDKRLAAVCGLFCPACTVYIGHREDPERIKAFAERVNLPLEELQCDGCRSEQRSFFCRNICTMSKCAADKGLNFCSECAEYPCHELKDFQKRMPNRLELWQSLDRIKEVGYEKWFVEMLEHYACPQCGVLNAAPDIKCRKCGAEPGSNYVRLHKEEILQHIDRIKKEGFPTKI